MATSPSKTSNMSTATKDAMFLFDLFRESPTPILIHIGPFANKTGAKPNTIIKRLAGIKARNGLNISTTLGDYKRPSLSETDATKTKPSSKTVKKERSQFCGSNAGLIDGGKVAYMASGALRICPEPGQALLTPTASPSSSVSSPRSFYPSHPVEQYAHSNHAPSPVKSDSEHLKRTFQQTLEPETEHLDVERTAWKRVKLE